MRRTAIRALWLPLVAGVALAVTPADARPEPFALLNVAAQDAAISADHVWARATPPNATTGAAYLVLTNKGQPDRLTGASAPVAGMVGLHQTTNDGGIMKMRPIPALDLDTDKPVRLAPGGYHIMLMDIKRPLRPGEHFALTLRFERSAPLTVDVSVEAIGASGPAQ